MPSPIEVKDKDDEEPNPIKDQKEVDDVFDEEQIDKKLTEKIAELYSNDTNSARIIDSI